MTSKLPTRMVMCAAVVLGTLPGQKAAAEEPQPVQSLHPSLEHPDVVRLNNGGFIRGTIAESIPNESVTIVTITGETKRIAMSEVEYAGPISKLSEPGTVPAPAESPQKPPNNEAMNSSSSTSSTKAGEDTVEVQFESEPAGAIFYQRSDITTTVMTHRGVLAGIGYKMICTAPCKAVLPIGTYALAMSYEGSPPREAAPVRVQKQTTRLHGDYVSRSGERGAGVAVLVSSVIGGGVVSGIGFARTKTECLPNIPCKDIPDPDSGMIAAGTGITLVGVAVAVLLLTSHDEVGMSVTPADSTPANSTTRDPATVPFKRSSDVWNTSWQMLPCPGANLLSYSVHF